MVRKFRVVIELLLPDEDKLSLPDEDKLSLPDEAKFKDPISIREWVTAWVDSDLIYEADAEFDGKVVEVTELAE